MKNWKIEELAKKLDGTITARKYLVANPIALELLTKGAAEYEVWLASRNLYSCFVDTKLWQGVEPEDEREVGEALHAAYESVSVNEAAKKSLAVHLECFKKFTAHHAVA